MNYFCIIKTFWTLPSSTNKTWFYNHVDEIFIDGPILNTARFYHAAGLLLDSVTQGNLSKGIDNKTFRT